MMQKNGPASRRSAARSHSGSAIPCRRPDTALAQALGGGRDGPTYHHPRRLNHAIGSNVLSAMSANP